MTKDAKNGPAANEERWTAVVLAGQRPGIDPLAAAFGGSFKALVEIEGEPMLTHVVRALSDTPEIGRIIVLGQSPALLELAARDGAAHVELRQSNAGISTSIQALLDDRGASLTWPILVTTADHPLLTQSIISAFLRAASTARSDLAIGMVERAVMLSAYPDNRRTWLKFSDGWWSGANLFALTGPRCDAALGLWAEAEQDRKKAWKLFLHFGPWLAFRALTRTIGLADALRRAGRRLGMSISLIPMDQAEAAIDVDKPSDHALASQILTARRA